MKKINIINVIYPYSYVTEKKKKVLNMRINNVKLMLGNHDVNVITYLGDEFIDQKIFPNADLVLFSPMYLHTFISENEIKKIKLNKIKTEYYPETNWVTLHGKNLHKTLSQLGIISNLDFETNNETEWLPTLIR